MAQSYLPSERSSTPKDVFQQIRWAHRQPIPAEHKLLLAHLALVANRKTGIAWPAYQTLANALLLPIDRVEWLLQELDHAGLIAKSSVNGNGQPCDHAWKPQYGIELDRSNPLMGLLLQERVWRLPSLTHGERWAMLALSRLYDWDTGQVRVSYRQICGIMPFWKDKGRKAWKMTLWRITDKYGYIRLVSAAANQYEFSVYEFHLPQIGDLKMSTPNAGGDLKMSTPNAGGDLKMSTPNAEPPYREEPRRTNKESPPPPPRLSVAAAADRYSEFFSVLFKEFRDRSIHAPLDMAHYSKARSSLAVAVAEDPKDAGRNISPYWARKVAELVEEAQPYTVPGFIAVQLQNWIDLGDDLTQDLTPEPESEPARFVETSTSDIDECARQIWDEALDMIQLSVTRPNFETWLKRTVGVAYRDGEFVVGAENAFIAESLEQRMYSLIARTLKSVLKAEVEVRFEVVGKVVGPGLS